MRPLGIVGLAILFGVMLLVGGTLLGLLEHDSVLDSSQNGFLDAKLLAGAGAGCAILWIGARTAWRRQKSQRTDESAGQAGAPSALPTEKRP
ncbi:MAG TPA: hypothetical protein VM327_09040 [Candidatus Thermoplasmatota archaeon]|nr:hypothetical protein [Candidatus Thermoplasmatota archaeon]